MSLTDYKSAHERDFAARRLADEGLGWRDLVVRLGLSEASAKQIVAEQWHRKQSAIGRGEQ
jgi:hypothetical protein